MTTDSEDQMNMSLMRKDVDALSVVFAKLEIAIDKLTEVSNSIHRMLAVHENRLGQQEETTKSLILMTEERRKESNERQEAMEIRMKEHRKELQEDLNKTLESLSKKLDSVANTVSQLEKWKYLVVGGSIVVGIILSKIPILENIFAVATK
jgi:Flp pilus assembly protein TadB